MQITVEKPPPIACTSRSHCTCSTVVAKPMAIDAAAKMAKPIRPIRLRPIWSENEPPKNWPSP